MRLPSLNALRAFEAAARHGGYIRAGEELHVTKGAISRHVKLLEEHLGTALFRRLTNGVELTDAGRALADVLARSFGQIAEETERLRAGAQDLRVICPPTTSIRWLMPKLGRFRERYPDIRLRLTTDFYGDGGYRPGEHDVGISVVNWPRPPGSAEVAPLFPSLLTPACAPGLAEGLRDPRDLAKVPRLHAPPRQDWSDWLMHFGISGVDDTGDDFPNADLAVQAARLGAGVVMLDVVLFQDDLATGHLVAPFPDMVAESPYGDACLIGAREVWNTRKVRVFREWLLEEAGATRAGLT